MNALLHISGSPEWPQELNAPPWPLLPVGNRPLLEYWFELCVDLGIQTVQIVMSDFASEIEAYAGDGARWGLNVSYGFEKNGSDPVAYLRRSSEKWQDGLLHIRGPLFPARTEAYCADKAKEKLAGAFSGEDGARLVIARTPDEISAYLNGQVQESLSTDSGIDPVVLTSTAEFFHVNQRVVKGESQRYLTSGYQITADNCFIGANTVIPPTAKIQPPVIVGDNCRISELTTIGPCAVIGNNVMIDQRTELENCMVLDGSYIGQNMEIRKKIISRSYLYDVTNDIGMHMPDPWLLGSTRLSKNSLDTFRAVLGWMIALVSSLLMVLPYALLKLLLCTKPSAIEKQTLPAVRGKTIRLRITKPPLNPGRRMKIFYRFSLDRFPLLLRVLSGKLWLCGHSVALLAENETLKNELPLHFPAAISYEDLQSESTISESTHRANAFFYLEERSPLEDIRIFIRFIIHRLFALWAE